MEDNTDRQVTTVNPFLYRGYYYDWETGMYYLQSRYYVPSVGRFANSDKTQYLLSEQRIFISNLFAYCDNNALNYSDPYGYYKISNFNCYSYAMGINDKWLHPGSKQRDVKKNRWLSGLPYYYTVDWVVSKVILDFGKSQVRKVSKKAKLKKGEYLVATRVSIFIGPLRLFEIRPTFDFHFMKKDKSTGKWWHKPGSTKIVCLGKINPDKRDSWTIYNSVTRYLAVKREFWTK